MPTAQNITDDPTPNACFVKSLFLHRNHTKRIEKEFCWLGWYVNRFFGSFLPEAHLIIFGDYLFQSGNASVHVSMTLKT